MIEHDKLPNRGNITDSETRVENRQVQNANISRALAHICMRQTARAARREGVPVARHEARRVRAARRAESAPRDAPDARRVRARARPFFSVEAGGASKLLAGGAGGWLTVRPPQAAWGEGRPPLPWQPRGVAPST